MKVDLSMIPTEQQNANTMNIDQLSTLDMVELINREDQRVIDAIGEQTHSIAKAVDLIADGIENGGRLIYIGAGTSGRLGVLDASEVLPTFGVGEEAVVGLIAGGDIALRHPVEAAEDDKEAVRRDLDAIQFNNIDILCAIAASGRTPYCVSGLEYAKEIGAQTLSVACVAESVIGKLADVAMDINVGQEVVTGSTRMKSGSATKMVLNMLTTGSMIKLGKVYGNLMVDVKTSNEKLIERAKNIIMKATQCDYQRAEFLLEAADKHVKSAIFMEKTGLDYESSSNMLDAHKGHMSKALEEFHKHD